ncbi:peptidoglycan editing factor PgeF [Fontimonas sp. SYSU GA230001]|uniref:peptidoglycan editing factor PgeF n=1 Tax=Fontimonas sp. SYSU GA230001 TaxID=3142450 RepID=UPI0032B4A0F6
MADVVWADWPAPPRVRAGQTLRTGGCSGAPYDGLNLAAHVGDDPDAVVRNRQILRSTLQLPAEPEWLCQVHGTGVAELPGGRPAPQADAAWTSRPGVVCAVLTADCLPVLFAAADGSVVAAAHAGWRGLAAGVLETTLAALPLPARRVHAWLGAAISQAHFEVGPEVRRAFVEDDAIAADCFVRGRGDRWFADLYGLACLRLRRMGVQSISGGGACTYRDAQRYYSHRRDGRCGRMASLIWIAGD